MRNDRDREHRRRKSGQTRRARRGFLWTAALLVFFSAGAMGMVWLNFRYTSTWLDYETARSRNETLRSDLNSHRLKLLNKVRLKDLNPRARGRLGMEDPSVDDIRLVHLDPSLDRHGLSEPGIMDRIIPAAEARESSALRVLSGVTPGLRPPSGKEKRP